MKSNIHPHETGQFFQATFPLGFKSAVYICHTFAASCIEESGVRFKRMLPPTGVPDSFRDAKILRVEYSSGIMSFNPDIVLCLHIVDDINCVFVDWPHIFVVHFHTALDSVLEKNGLPVHKEKYMPKGRYRQTPSVLLDGNGTYVEAYCDLCWTNMKAHKQLEEALGVNNPSESIMRRSVRGLVWHALGLRPLLSVVSHTFP